MPTKRKFGTKTQDNIVCMKLMSKIYQSNKINGCKWKSSPYRFLQANKKLFCLSQNDFHKSEDFSKYFGILNRLSGMDIISAPERPLKPVSGYSILMSFMKSRDGIEKWRQLRYEALRASGGRCCLCGISTKQGATLHVDHIKPKSLYPELAFCLDNLQVLCSECNLGKSNRDETDFR